MGISFYDWCQENKQYDILNRFNVDLNQMFPNEITIGSKKKIWFDCPEGKHPPHQFYMYNVTKNPEHNVMCPYCKSIGNLYPKIFEIWSDKNEKSPFDFLPGSEQKVWVKCTNGIHDDYLRSIYDIVKGNFGCSKCSRYSSGYPEDLTGIRFGKLLVIKQDENDPSRWICICDCQIYKENPKQKSILRGHLISHKIQSCGCLHVDLMTGENNWAWKGGISPERVKLRESDEYYVWRNTVGTRDNFTCQCCGLKTKKVEAHHLFSFIQYEDLRYDVNNGICLCRYCHNAREDGSFHNVYGTHNNTPDQLHEYILNKSGIDIYETHPEILQLISTQQNNYTEDDG